EQFALDLLREQKILVSHGTAFNWPNPDHFRLVTLPSVEVLTEAIERLDTFLSGYRQVAKTTCELPVVRETASVPGSAAVSGSAAAGGGTSEAGAAKPAG